LDQVLGYRITGTAENVFMKIDDRLNPSSSPRIDAGTFTTYIQYFLR
jgi:hypothetical protein